MNRLMFFAVLLFQSTVVFGQSTATLLGSPQTQGKVSTRQWALDFVNGQPGQTLTGPLFKNFDCKGSSAVQTQASAPVDLDHLVNAPCADLESQVEFLARNESAFSRSPLAVQPHSKFGPIPTQWPNAKTEQIPTQWANLKLQPIDGGSSGLAPAHDSAK